MAILGAPTDSGGTEDTSTETEEVTVVESDDSGDSGGMKDTVDESGSIIVESYDDTGSVEATQVDTRTGESTGGETVHITSEPDPSPSSDPVRSGDPTEDPSVTSVGFGENVDRILQSGTAPVEGILPNVPAGLSTGQFLAAAAAIVVLFGVVLRG